MTSIPIVDLGSDMPADELARRVTDICHDIGFFVVVNHGVAADFVDSIFDMMARFFALPDEQKLLIDERNSPHFRGWEALGSESTNNRADIREVDGFSSCQISIPVGEE